MTGVDLPTQSGGKVSREPGGLAGGYGGSPFTPHNFQPGRAEAVISLYNEGLTYSEIAIRLGLRNRSMVSGLVNRLRKAGLLAPAGTRAKPVRQKAKAPSAPRKRARTLHKNSSGLIVGKPFLDPSRPRVQTPGGRAALLREMAANPPAMIAADRASAFEPLPGTMPVPLVANTGCKWPVDGLHGKGLLCCGEPYETTGPYCRHHRILAAAPR